MKRLTINLLIVAGILLFGSILTPKGSGFVGSPGTGGRGVTPPENFVDRDFMFRGQVFTSTFWGQISPLLGNVTMLPVDFYVMNFEQYLGFLESHSTESILHVNASFDSVVFKPERSGPYFFIWEMLEPVGEKCCIGYRSEVKGFNLNFLQPTLVFLISAIALLMYNLFQWLSIRGRKQVFQPNLERITPPQEASKKGSK